MSEHLTFQFYCSPGQEDRAVEILQNIDCVEQNSISFDASQIRQVTFDPETGIPYITPAGFGIIGQAIPTCIDRIIQALAEEQIAGYSRETMVIFFDPDEYQEFGNSEANF